MKISLRVFGLIGLIVFCTGFGLTYSVPGFVEDIGKTFIQNTIIEKTTEKVDQLGNTLDNPNVNKLIGKLIKKNQDQIDHYKTQLKNKAHEKVVEVIAQMSDLDCECRKKYSDMIKAHYQFKLASLNQFNDKLTGFMKSKYMEVSQKLKQDFRIFTGINALVFLILVLLSFAKPQAIKPLFVPAVLLLVSSLICSYFYLFQQNWFFTIIFDSYVGWFYLTYLAVVFAFLCDISFNEARITNIILDVIQSAINSISIVPC